MALNLAVTLRSLGMAIEAYVLFECDRFFNDEMAAQAILAGLEEEVKGVLIRADVSSESLTM